MKFELEGCNVLTNTLNFGGTKVLIKVVPSFMFLYTRQAHHKYLWDE